MLYSVGRFISCSLSVSGSASAGTRSRRACPTCAVPWSTGRGAPCPGCRIVITNQANGTFREVVSNADGSWYMPGLAPGAYQVSAELDWLQAVPAPRPAGDRRHHDDRPGIAGAGRPRGDDHRHQRGPAHRRDLEADRRQSRHQGPDPAAEHLAQLARLRRPASGRHPGAEPGVVGLGDDLGQRRRLAQQLVPGRRRLGQRRLPGPEQRRPGPRADRGRAGIANPHRAVRRRVRPHLRGDRQRGDQVGHQPVCTAPCSRSTRTKQMRAEDFFVHQNNLEEPDPTKRNGAAPSAARSSGTRRTSSAISNACRSTRAGRSRSRRGPT